MEIIITACIVSAVVLRTGMDFRNALKDSDASDTPPLAAFKMAEASMKEAEPQELTALEAELLEAELLEAEVLDEKDS